MIRVDDRDGVKWFVVTDENGQEVEWVPGRFGVLIAHEVEQLQQRLAAAEARLRRYEPEPDICEHGVTEGDWCEPCNREYKAAAEDEAAKGGRDATA